MFPPRLPPGVDPSKPSVARVYDALLGGTENFPADRAIADRLLAVVPQLGELTLGHRIFIRRVVDWLVEEEAITQLIDLGGGLPTLQNTHEVAQHTNPSARVVYVDIDPLVEIHARMLLSENLGATAITADAREVYAILHHPALTNLIDLSRPVGILMMGLVHLFPDSDRPHEMIRRYMNGVVPGSCLAVTHLARSTDPQAKALEATLRSTMDTGFFRTHAEIMRFFDGLELVDPGLTSISQWRSTDPSASSQEPWTRLVLGAVARKPAL